MSQSDLASEMKSDFRRLPADIESQVPALPPSVCVSVGCVGGRECQEVRKGTQA